MRRPIPEPVNRRPDEPVLRAGVPFSHARRAVNGGVTDLVGRVVSSCRRLPRPRRWVGS